MQRIRPKQIVERTILGRLNYSIDIIDLFKSFKFIRDASMDAKVISIDNGCKRQLLKQVQCFLIALLVVQMQHLLSEVVTLSAVSRLMVTSKQKDVVRIADFQAEEIGNDLWLVLASINVVAQENKFLAHSLLWEANLSQYV